MASAQLKSCVGPPNVGWTPPDDARRWNAAANTRIRTGMAAKSVSKGSRSIARENRSPSLMRCKRRIYGRYGDWWESNARRLTLRELSLSNQSASGRRHYNFSLGGIEKAWLYLSR